MKSERYKQARRKATNKLWADPEYRAKQKAHPWRSHIRIFENPYSRKAVVE